MTKDEENKQTALEKIKKLLRLEISAKDIGNDGEAAAAAKGIHRLLTMYNLKLSEVQLEDNKKEYNAPKIVCSEKFDYRDGFYGEWKRRLLIVLCDHNYCWAVINPASHVHYIIGESETVEVVKNLYLKIIKYFVSMVTARELDMWDVMKYTENRARFVITYYNGAITGIEERLKEIQPTAEERALAVCYDSAIADFVKRNFAERKNDNPYHYTTGCEEVYNMGMSDAKCAPLQEMIENNDQ